MIQRELQCEVSFLRPCSEEGSDVAEPYKLVESNSRLRQQCRKIDMSNGRHGGSWVEPLPISEKIEQVRGLSVPNPYHCATDASSLDGDI